MRVDLQPTASKIARNESAVQEVLLRDYQADGVTRIRAALAAGVSKLCFSLPTGGGKTVLFAYVVAGAAARGKRVLILSHRIELVQQISGAMMRQGVEHGLIAADSPETNCNVQVASISTLARRLDRWRDRFDLVVIDETHHAVAGSWASVIASQPRAKILGVTATPERLDGRGLGEIFDTLVEGPSAADLIAAGWLAPFTVYTPADAPDLSGVKIRAGDYAVDELRERMGGVVISSAVRGYQEHCPGKRVIVFAVDCSHSREVVGAFQAAGIKASHIDGETPAAERKATLAAFARREIRVLCNVALFGEGFDLPELDGVMMLRPTASLGLYLQMAGRALRPAPGKERALILDFAGNSLRHGLPDAPRQWSLDAKPTRQRPRSDAPAVRRCAACGAVNAPHVQECRHCDADLRTARERREIEIKLREAQAAREAARIRAMSYAARLRWAGEDEARLRAVARACAYKDGWVFRRLQEMSGVAA